MIFLIKKSYVVGRLKVQLFLIIQNLFFNTPARFKFLKKDVIEATHVSDIVSRIALGNPNMAFKFINNKKNLFYTRGKNDLLSVIFSIYGKDTAKNVMEINYKDDKITISGFIGKPDITRSTRNQQSFYVNGR